MVWGLMVVDVVVLGEVKGGCLLLFPGAFFAVLLLSFSSAVRYC